VTDQSLIYPGDSRGGPGKHVSYTRLGPQRGLRFGGRPSTFLPGCFRRLADEVMDSGLHA
jgi:hypothetical protein